MPNSIHPDFLTDNPINHAIITDAKLPIAFEPMTQRFSVIAGLGRQSLFDSPENSCSQIEINCGKISLGNFRVVEEPVSHYRRRL